MDSKDKRVQEIQILEQTLYNISFQKQSFQLELSETIETLGNLESSDGEIFKIVGQLMIKSDKKKTQEELFNKQKLLELRIKSIEKEENSLAEKVNSLRQGLINQNKK
jgi:prefoldin beta subunit